MVVVVVVLVVVVAPLIIIIITQELEMGHHKQQDRTDATMYSLGTWFVSGICVWIPCIMEKMMMVVIVVILIIIIIIIYWVHILYLFLGTTDGLTQTYSSRSPFYINYLFYSQLQ
jgi:hypothetical protein